MNFTFHKLKLPNPPLHKSTWISLFTKLAIPSYQFPCTVILIGQEKIDLFKKEKIEDSKLWEKWNIIIKKISVTRRSAPISIIMIVTESSFVKLVISKSTNCTQMGGRTMQKGFLLQWILVFLLSVHSENPNS